MDDVRRMLHASVEEYTDYDYKSKNISYSELLRRFSLEAPESNKERRLTDLVTLVAWTTDASCTHEMLSLSMNQKEPHAFRISFDSGDTSLPHCHNYIELMCVMEGQVTQNIRGENVTFSEGEICLVNTRVEHFEYLFAQNTTVLWLGVDDSFFEKYEHSKDPRDDTQSLKKLINQKRFQYYYIRFTPMEENTRTIQAFTTIFYEMLHNLPGKNRLIIGYVERIVDLLTREYHLRISQKDREELHQAIITDICDYIARNYAKTSVSRIAAVYHYSPDYLNRIFQKKTGRTISAYLQKVRIEHAMQTIQTTDLPIEQAARQCGYHNLGFFYKKFREYYRCTPDSARKSGFRRNGEAAAKCAIGRNL